MPFPEGSHGTSLQMEKVGDAAGTFTTVALLDNEITRNIQNAVTEIMPHDKGVVYRVVSPVKNLQPFELAGTFDKDEATHDVTNGLQARHLGTNTVGTPDTFGIRMIGPDGSTTDDYILCSGQISAWSQTNPNDAGSRRFSCTFSPSGPFEVDGVQYV